MNLRSVRGAAVVLSILAGLSSALPALSQTNDADRQARALFAEYWEWVLREYPDSATLYFGDHRYDDKLRDESAAAVIGRNAALATFRDRTNQIDPAKLSPQERVSMYVLQFRLDASLAVNKGHGPLPFGVFDSWAPVNQMGGLHLDLPQLATAARFQSVGDYEAWLKRLEAVPESVARLIERMTLAMNAGWMPPKVAISGVPRQLEVQLVDDVQKSPEYEPFKSFPKDMAQSEQSRLAVAGERAIRDKLIPAFRSLKSFYETRYLERAAAAPQSVEASGRPDVLPGVVGLVHNDAHDPSPDPRPRTGRGGTHRFADGRHRRGQWLQRLPRGVPKIPLERSPVLLYQSGGHARSLS